jgi:hypothetical protein
MYGCSILIGHTNTLYYLKFCIEQIRKYRHPEIPQEIILVDQSPELIFKEVQDLYGNDADIQLLRLAKVDLGFAIDTGVKAAQFDFFCTLDCDAFPIHRNWLYLPIQLIQKYNFSFIGNNTGLELSYKEKGHFFHLNNYYRVSRTDLARKLSETVGFIRPGERNLVNFKPKDDTWGNDYADVGVVAQWYTDQNKLGDKLSLEISSHLGMTNKQGIYGMVIDDLVFHMVFGPKEDVDDSLGSAFLDLREWVKQEGLSEPLIRDFIEHSTKRKTTRRINGQDISCEMDSVIEQIKNS